MDSPFLLNHANGFFYGLGAFIVFVIIIAKFGIKPIVSAIDARDAKIKAQLDEAEQTFAKAKELQANLDAQLSGTEAKIAEMLREAEKDGEEHKAKIVAEGGAEVELMRTRALREIEAARHEAILALRQEVADVSTIVAEKILHKELDAGSHQELVAEAVDSYEASFQGGAEG